MRCSLSPAALLLLCACLLAADGAVLRSRKDNTVAASQRKMRNGPPSEFASFAVPQATSGALFEADAAYFVALCSSPRLAADGSVAAGYSFSKAIALDAASDFTFAVVLPGGKAPENLRLSAPDGTELNLADHANEGYFPMGDGGLLSGQPKQTFYTFTSAVSGVYSLSFEDSAASIKGSQTDGIVYTWVDSQDGIYSHLNSYESSLRVNDQLGVVARMYDNSQYSRQSLLRGVIPKAQPDVVSTAQLIVTMPDLSLKVIDMHDDGLHGDGLADDGVFGGHFQPTVEGAYLMQSALSGKHADGTAFYRSAEHVVEVVPNDLQLTGKVAASLHNGRVSLDIGVQEDTGNNYEGTYIAYTQVWGRQLLTGKAVPVAWAQARVDPVGADAAAQAVGGNAALQLSVDARWFLQAGAVGPITLKDVQVHEAHTMDIVAEADEIEVGHTVAFAAALNATLAQLRAKGLNGQEQPDEAMLMGPRPANMLRSRANGTNGDHKLVLVHGYCTERNPFLDAYDWTDGIFFLDAKASRSNDDFAQRVLNFIETDGGNPSSYSTVGHSQGGMVQLHLYNFYWTGIDNDGAGRKIQSLATPYQGSGGLAALNAIGPLIGGCGDNVDLGRDGAVQWLAQISPESRAQMYYYTTEGSPKACSGLTNMFIKKPNDGVTENIYAELVGGNFLGNTKGECHAYNFDYPPSFLNTDRNKEMNDNSARA